MNSEDAGETPPVHRRRPRYRGKNPRRFEDKYKELRPDQYPSEVAKVIASGKTPAGQHLPIMVTEVLACLRPHPGARAVDCTLGYGGHTRAIWRAVQPKGHLLSLDADPIEILRSEQRLRAEGMAADTWTVRRCNFAGLAKAVADQGWSDGVDVIFADLGLSSMQIDNPARGFTFKQDGPLDMRMNPRRGQPASALLSQISETDLRALLEENADEPRAALLAQCLSRQVRQTAITTTGGLADAVRAALPPRLSAEERTLTVRRVFQALRIAVNDEFTALDTLLRALPGALRSGGRAAILTFHSGEDRRVKKAFQEGHRSGVYSDAAQEILRPTAEEQRLNPRSAPAKLRWAVRA